MDTNTNDLNNDQVVTDQDLQADMVNQQDLKDGQAVTDQNQDVLADGTDANKQVPYSKLKEAADARKAAEEQAAHAQRQLELLQAQQQGAQMAQQQNTQQAQPSNTYELAMQQLGFTTEDMYDPENQVKVQRKKSDLDGQLMQAQQTAMAAQQFTTSKNDITQVVGSVNPTTGQVMTMSPALSDLLVRKPHLKAACTSVQAIYDLVKQDQKLAEYEKAALVNQQHLARQKADATVLPLGASSAGGAGGVGAQSGQQLMSREQVAEIERKLENGEQIT